VSEPVSSDPQAWASSVVRRFARATNLLIAGKRFSIHGSHAKASALAGVLAAIGARSTVGDERPDYLFCTDDADPLVLSEIPADAGSRPIVVIDAADPGGAIDATSMDALTEVRSGVFATPRSDVFVVKLGVPVGEASVDDARGRIRWARRFMPTTAAITREIAEAGLIDGLRVGLSMVLEPKTAVLALALKDTGADVTVFAHPDETDDAVATALRDEGIAVFARSDADPGEHRESALAFLDTRPQLLIDDGSHVIRLAHTDRSEALDSIIGAAEETTSGLRPLRLMAAEGELRIPVVAVNDARSKTLFDNRFGTGQSCVFTILDLLDLDAAERTVVVAGYGHVGEGVAHHARALGATVIVAELDPVRALQASFAGHRVMPLIEAVREADIVISATGARDTISLEVLRACSTGAAVAVAGGVPQEVAIDAAVSAGATRQTIGHKLERFQFSGGSSVIILDDGGCINITAGEGNPIEIMDLSFAVQASALRYLVDHALTPGVYPLPTDADDAVAAISLGPAGIEIDRVAVRAQGDTVSADWHSARFVDGPRGGMAQ
jgi:adenosylhomocysteinase